jgi:hypothetical protein
MRVSQLTVICSAEFCKGHCGQFAAITGSIGIRP